MQLHHDPDERRAGYRGGDESVLHLGLRQADAAARTNETIVEPTSDPSILETVEDIRDSGPTRRTLQCGGWARTGSGAA